jgi:hypothetical protein
MSLNLDLHQNMFNDMKFSALHLKWLWWSSSHSYNLAIHWYAPTIKDHNNHASCTLFSWAKGVMQEFDIELYPHVLTSNFDSGSEVKSCLEMSWCLCTSGVYPTCFTSPSSMLSASTLIQPSARTRMHEKYLLMSARWWRRSISRRH